MKIGNTIHTLRKTKQMTQEQLAAAVGVSTPAVSKWETGSAYPDITLLAPLARVLDTTIDNLLSYRQELSSQDVNVIKSELRGYFETHGFRAGMEKGMEYIRQYPNSDRLKLEIGMMAVNLAYTIDADYTDEELLEMQKKNSLLYEQVLKSEDKELRYMAAMALISVCMQNKEYDRAEELLNSLPAGRKPCPDKLYPTLYLMKEDYNQALELAGQQLLGELNEVLMSLMTFYTAAKRRQDPDGAAYYARTYADLVRQFGIANPNGEFLLLDAFLAKGDTEQALNVFQQYIDSVIGLDLGYSRDNPFFGKQKQDNIREKEAGIKKSVYKAIMADQSFELIRDSEIFKQGMEKLERHIQTIQ